MGDFIGAVDQGTTSTRFMVFDHDGRPVAKHQLEHEQILPQRRLGRARPARDLGPHPDRHRQRAAAGRPRQPPTSPPSASPTSARRRSSGTATPAARSTTPSSGRTPAPTRIAKALDADGARRRHPAQGRAAARHLLLRPARCSGSSRTSTGCGPRPSAATPCSAPPTPGCVWNLTGGPDGGVHVTDVTNASRTMLMDLATLDWDDELLGFFGIPRAMLPAIRLEQRRRPRTARPHRRPVAAAPVPISGDLGDQQAATVGQVCFEPGEAKNTYGTGNFMLLNTGDGAGAAARTACSPRSPTGSATRSRSTRSRGRSPSPVARCSGCATSSASSPAPPRVEALAASVEDTGGVYFVPAFSGLFAPYWRCDARGAIVGLSRFNTNAHLARATLEAICYQTRDVVDAMAADSGVALDLPQGRRRHHREPAVHAAAGRHPRRAGVASRSSPRPRRWARRTPPAWRPASGRAPTSCARTGPRTSGGSRSGATPSAATATPAGRRPWSAPSDWVDVE